MELSLAHARFSRPLTKHFEGPACIAYDCLFICAAVMSVMIASYEGEKQRAICSCPPRDSTVRASARKSIIFCQSLLGRLSLLTGPLILAQHIHHGSICSDRSWTMTCAFPPVCRPNAALMQKCTCEHRFCSVCPCCWSTCSAGSCQDACRARVSCLQVCFGALILCAFVIEVVAVREVNVRSSKF